jgi:hypothetical protein
MSSKKIPGLGAALSRSLEDRGRSIVIRLEEMIKSGLEFGGTH